MELLTTNIAFGLDLATNSSGKRIRYWILAIVDGKYLDHPINPSELLDLLESSVLDSKFSLLPISTDPRDLYSADAHRRTKCRCASLPVGCSGEGIHHDLRRRMERRNGIRGRETVDRRDHIEHHEILRGLPAADQESNSSNLLWRRLSHAEVHQARL